MRKKILVPTDFSEKAYYAAQYACQIALKNDFDIHLFHCYTTSTAISTDDSDIPKGDLLMEELKKKLIQEYPGVVIESKCVSRLLIDVIPEYAVAPQFEFIVIGTTGANHGRPVIWGSNTAFVTNNVSIPVLAIPSQNEFRTSKVAILTNFKAEELESLNNFTKLCGPIEKLDIIHIYKDAAKAKDIHNDLEDWAFNIKQLSNVHEVNIIAERTHTDNQELDTVPEVINQIITDNDYDMVIVTKTRKSFFNRLINGSVSRKIVLTLQKPTFFDNIKK
ncbi:universal stress protein [Sphingobacterium thermophilum]|uniref:Universal stress protein n=1 Tax=Sphingobacterium thermophilum TaxID=768534 RepID=A0ABP8R856_9SPHI